MIFAASPNDCTPSKNGSIAFEIVDGKPTGKTPKRLLEQLKAIEKLEQRMSKEDLTLKLDEAAERKRIAEESRINKAKLYTDRIKEAHERVKKVQELEIQRLAKLESKLAIAEKLKEDQVQQKKRSVAEHNEMVYNRMDAFAQDYPMMAQEEYQKKLEEAEDRRKTLEEMKLYKLSQHHRTVDERGKASHSCELVQLKLEAAEMRRKEQEMQQKEKFQIRNLRIQEASRRRSSLCNSSFEKLQAAETRRKEQEESKKAMFELRNQRIENATKRRNSMTDLTPKKLELAEIRRKEKMELEKQKFLLRNERIEQARRRRSELLEAESSN